METYARYSKVNGHLLKLDIGDLSAGEVKEITVGSGQVILRGPRPMMISWQSSSEAELKQEGVAVVKGSL